MSKFRFGKHPPVKDYRTLLLRNYASTLPAPADKYNVLDDVYKNLGTNDPAVLFPMDGNDQYGDCTIAAAGHAITVYNGLTKKKDIPAKTGLLKTYFQLTGGPDTGLDELKVLNYWQSTGIGTEKILAFVSIDPKNHMHIKQAIQFFGGVYLGFQVQQNADQLFDERKPWTPAPLTNDGHAVYAVAYDADQVTVLTWGNTQLATWSWWDECVDEAYAILPPEAKNAGYAQGFDFAKLQADLEAVAK
ncbi:MAG TPA: hypothetical protein VFE32_04555 [Puia sp.]|jgi:hypothetical protein|nr:hypothetical protein [Puia sp.]